MKFTNLEQLRNHSGKTLEDVASTLGVSKSTIHNWEKEPENVPMGKLNDYARAINYSLDDLLEREIIQDKTLINVEPNRELYVLRSELRNNIQKISKYYEINRKRFVLGNENILASILNDIKTLQVGIRKPRVAIVGESDSGKSTFINYILNQGDILPARWQPATSCVIKLAHIDDKPDWLFGNTVVIKSSQGEPVDETWDLLDSKYDNEIYFSEHVVEQGTRELIAQFGDREGISNECSLEDVYTIYTFLDAELLKTIEIWDTPGIGAGDDIQGESDEILSLYAQANADMLIYLSVTNQFIHSNDIAYLRQAIKRLDTQSDFKNGLPAWNNLIIIASQAHMTRENERDSILNIASERLINQFGDDFLDIKNGYDKKAFRNRFFTFSKDNEFTRKDVENEINTLLKNKSELILSESKIVQKNFYNDALQLIKKILTENKELLVEKNEVYNELKEATDNLESVLKANLLISENLNKASQKGRDKSELEFSKFYNSSMTEKQLLEWLDSQNVKNKKESKKEFNTWLSGKLQDKLENVLTANGEVFKEEFEKIGEDVQKTFNISVSSFDFTAVMAGLVASGIVGGAFAVVAAGITSNLGLYILVAQVGGLLTSRGVISSPVALTTLVSATGGPVGWVIGLSILAGTLISWVFSSSSWKNKYVKQIKVAYEKNEALSKFSKAINEYWDKTDESITKLKESMDLVAHENINILEKKYNSNPEDLDIAINQLEDVLLILENCNKV